MRVLCDAYFFGVCIIKVRTLERQNCADLPLWNNFWAILHWKRWPKPKKIIAVCGTIYKCRNPKLGFLLYPLSCSYPLSLMYSSHKRITPLPLLHDVIFERSLNPSCLLFRSENSQHSSSSQRQTMSTNGSFTHESHVREESHSSKKVSVSKGMVIRTSSLLSNSQVSWHVLII